MKTLSYPWQIIFHQIIKEGKIEKRTPFNIVLNNEKIQSLNPIYEYLQAFNAQNLPLKSEIRIQRSDIDFENIKKTRVSIVNFEAIISTELYIKLIDAIFNDTLDLHGEVISLGFLRLMNNFTIYIDIKDFNNERNPMIIQSVEGFLVCFRKNSQEEKFNIEISSFPRINHPSERKMNFKNTSDSIQNLLVKQGKIQPKKKV